jgi:predicted acylesterase/phospholipase RssA
MADTGTRQDKNTFEIGLVLAGAVSAGAYSAGVADFLIEAIDRWYAAKESEVSRGVPRERWQVPPHDVRLRAISGSSAGSMVAALTAVALNEAPSAVNPARLPEKSDKTNKLYSSWVVAADIASMLTTADLKEKAGQLTSLLDSSFLKSLAEDTMMTRPPWQPRAYVADPLALFICVTNLRGVPYSIDFQGPKVIEHWMSNHADYLRFDVVKPGARHNGSPEPNSLFLHPDARDEKEKAAWKKLAQAAVASGAFPLALAPRIIQRDAGDYNERQWIIPSAGTSSGDGTPECSDREKIPPDWNGNAPTDYFFLAVDGGMMNNEPLEYARQEIAGAGRHNERSGEKATRAIVMIDPFPDAVPVSADYTAEASLFGVAGAIFRSLMSQAKFKIDELKLARDPNVFSRFVITPTRDKTERESQKEKWPALASNSLFHFGGFLHEDFRRHDFLLGRRNCQRFLQKYFILPVENPLFEQWPPDLKKAGSPYLRTVTVDGNETYYLPIIPLVGDLNHETREPQPPWPEMPEAELEKLKKGLSVRTKLVVNQAVSGLIGSGTSNSPSTKGKSVLLKAGLFVLKLLVKPLLGWFAGWLAGKILKKIKENLTAAELLKKGR